MLAYLAGACGGALATAVTAWVASGLLEPLGAVPRAALLVGGALFVWLSMRGPLASVVSLPQTRRQIPAQVFGGGLVRGAFRFGAELGTGVRTYVSSPAPYILLLALVAIGPTLGTAILAGLGFGLGRSAPIAARLPLDSRNRFTVGFLTGVDPLGPAAPAAIVLAGGLLLV